MKDYCTGFPEKIFGIYIGGACKKHDDTCSAKVFYNALKEDLDELVFNHELAISITMVATLFCWIKYTSKAFRVDIKDNT